MKLIRAWAAATVVVLATVVFPAAASGGAPVAAQVQVGCQDVFVQTGNGYDTRITVTTREGVVTEDMRGDARTVLNLNAFRLRDIMSVEVQVWSGGVVVLDRRTVTCESASGREETPGAPRGDTGGSSRNTAN